jgi:hypothetical protein
VAKEYVQTEWSNLWKIYTVFFGIR